MEDEAIAIAVVTNEAAQNSVRPVQPLGYHESFDVERPMKLPSTTSKLLVLQEATNAELRVRLAGIFHRYRKLAFMGRNDNLFTEHWTPEVAAAGYDFDGFEIKGANIVLHGVENACGFVYRINIALPLELIDDATAIEAYFQRRLDESKAESELTAARSGTTDPAAL
jgi:hypothetical protein